MSCGTKDGPEPSESVTELLLPFTATESYALPSHQSASALLPRDFASLSPSELRPRLLLVERNRGEHRTVINGVALRDALAELPVDLTVFRASGSQVSCWREFLAESVFVGFYKVLGGCCHRLLAFVLVAIAFSRLTTFASLRRQTSLWRRMALASST